MKIKFHVQIMNIIHGCYYYYYFIELQRQREVFQIKFIGICETFKASLLEKRKTAGRLDKNSRRYFRE